jgi:dihydrofolate reductase
MWSSILLPLGEWTLSGHVGHWTCHVTPFFPLRARFESVKSLGYAATGRQPRMKSSIQSEELTPAVGKLIYSAITSLDGYIEDENGNFDWAEPDEEVFAFVNEIERPIGTYLYGRRMYETMAGWETDEFIGDRRPVIVDFANIWRAADKIVFSRTLESVSTARTRIEATFNPDLIQKIKSSTKSDLTVAGAELAALAFRAGLIDECYLLLNPIVVGGGKQALPSKDRRRLDLLDEGRFSNGVVHLHYRVIN